LDLAAPKEAFSRAVVRAVAAHAGVMADTPERDMNSIDIRFAAPDTPLAPGARLEAQPNPPVQAT